MTMVYSPCRRNLDKLLRTLLVEEDTSPSLVQPILKLYERLHTGVEARINQLIEVMSDIRMPITNTQSTISQDARRKIDLKVGEDSVNSSILQFPESWDMI